MGIVGDMRRRDGPTRAFAALAALVFLFSAAMPLLATTAASNRDGLAALCLGSSIIVTQETDDGRKTVVSKIACPLTLSAAAAPAAEFTLTTLRAAALDRVPPTVKRLRPTEDRFSTHARAPPKTV